MLNRLYRYINKTILVTIGMVMLLLLGLDLVFSLVNEIRDIGTGDYGLWPAIQVLGLSVPQKIYQMFPMSALIGTLMGLGVLASNSELVVIQAAGISIRQITQSIVVLALVLGLLMLGLGEGAAPYLDKVAQGIKANAMSGGQALRTSHGTWLRDGDDFVHIRKLYVGGHLEGITRYQFNDSLELEKAIYASYGDYINKKWVLKDIQETKFGETITRQTKHEQVWHSSLSPSILSVVGEKYLEKLSMAGLVKTIQYRRHNGLDAKPFELALWEKISQPLSIAVMMFLAIPFIFGPLRQATMGLRLMSGILVGFAFMTINDMFGHLSLVYQTPPIIGAILPTFLFFGLGVLLLKRAKV